jgi:hypothetical protein
MQTLPEQDAIELFRSVRKGRDLATILNRFKDGDLLLQMHLVPETRLRYNLPYSKNLPPVLLESGSPYLDTVIYTPNFTSSPLEQLAGGSKSAPSVPMRSTHETQYVRPYHAATLVEPRLERARPSDWTTVCSDDVLLREILAAYFTHEYHLFPAFHKGYFLEDMQSPQADKREVQLCSSLLVNAVLAYGCVSPHSTAAAVALITHSTV